MATVLLAGDYLISELKKLFRRKLRASFSNIVKRLSKHKLHANNFARIHQILRVTPTMEAGIADQAWSLEEILNLLP
jgi:hypothetical protein